MSLTSSGATRLLLITALVAAGLSVFAGNQVQTVTPVTHRAVLSELVQLIYGSQAPPEADLAPHVRAASGVRRIGDKLWIVQDDVNAVAVQGGDGVRAILLPASVSGDRSFSEARGNKSHKLDLEASVVLPDGRLLAFGSGSTSARERLVTIGPNETVSIRDGAALYETMRRRADFSGSELNIEGAVVVGDVLRFFQRGNGAVVDQRKPINATADVALPAFLAWLDNHAPLPPLERVQNYDLGSLSGVPWTFTDATVANGQVVFVAAAEASPDTYRDGEVLGSCVGLLDDAGAAHVFPVLLVSGELAKIKLEGIEHKPGTAWAFDVVADMDNPDVPAMVGTVTLTAL